MCPRKLQFLHPRACWRASRSPGSERRGPALVTAHEPGLLAAAGSILTPGPSTPHPWSPQAHSGGTATHCKEMSTAGCTRNGGMELLKPQVSCWKPQAEPSLLGDAHFRGGVPHTVLPKCLLLESPYSGFPAGSVVKNRPAKAGDRGDTSLIPGSGRSPEGGQDNPLQSSCLKNPVDKGVWRATVHGVTKESDTT